MQTTTVAALALAIGAASALTGCGKKDKRNAPAGAKSPITETCEADFCIVAVRGSGKVDFNLRSQASAEVTVTMAFNLTNMSPSAALPLTTAAKGAADVPILTLTASNPAAGYSYKFDYDWGFGLATAQHDEAAVYRLPFATGASFNVVQGYNGAFSHTGEDQYAIDFAMPAGTPVHAARAGKVLMVEESYDRGGTDPALKGKANSVKISHADGTIAEYLHFEKNGIVVEKGDAVVQGQVLGTSGNTGFTSGPHLHIKVSRRIDGATAESLRLNFKTSATAPAAELEEGQTYTAVEVP